MGTTYSNAIPRLHDDARAVIINLIVLYLTPSLKGTEKNIDTKIYVNLSTKCRL